MIRYALYGLLNTVIMLVVLLAVAIAWIQTGSGQRFLAAELSSRLSTPDLGIKIVGINGRIPLDMGVARLELADRDGPWLDVSGLTLKWLPSALLRGRFEIERLGAERIHMVRSPAGSAVPDEPTDEPFRLPPLPSALPPVTLNQLTVETIDLDAPVLGEAARFKLDGSLIAADHGRQADLSLDLERLDQASAYLTLISTIDLAPARLAIDLDAGETGQLLEELTGRADAGDLDLTLSGQGPLDDWSGKLVAKADGLGTIEADLALALAEQPSLSLDALVRPIKDALPKEISEMIGDGLDLKLAATQTRAQALEINQLEATTAELAFKSSGRIDFETQDVTFNAALDAPRLDALSSTIGTTLAGEAGLTLDVAGTLQQPAGTLRLRSRGFSADGATIDDLDTNTRFTAMAPLDQDDASLDLTTTGSVRGLAIADTILPDRAIDWTADMVVPLDGAITLKEAVINTAGTSLQAAGTLHPETLVSDLDLLVDVTSLHRLASPYGQTLAGKASIKANVVTTERADNLSVDLAVGLSDLANLPDGASELLGSQAALDATMRLDDHRYLGVEAFRIEGVHTTLTGGADLDLESRDITSDLEATLPRLDVLASLLGQPIGGAIDLDAAIRGNMDQPEINLDLRSDQIDLGDEHLETLSLSIRGQNLDAAPEGNLKLDLTARSLPLVLAFDYRFDAPNLALKHATLEGPETTLSGDLEIDLDRTLIDGALTGANTSLAALRPLLATPLDGTITLRATLKPDGASQTASVDIEGRNLDGSFGKLDRFNLKAALSDVLGKPAMSATAEVEGFAKDDIELSTLSAQAEGDRDELTLDLALEGNVMQPLTLETAAALSLQDPIRIDIERLNGRFTDEPFKLNTPLTLEQSDTRLSLVGLDLTLGSARLKGEVNIGERDVAGHVDLRSLPLGWLERFDGPPIDGTAKVDIDLAGTVDNPKVAVDLRLDDVQADKVTQTELPPIDLAYSARLEAGQLTSNLQVNRLTNLPIMATAGHPLRLSLRPFSVEAPEDGAIVGEADLAVSLARVGDILALDGQVMQGDLVADLTFSGTIREPIIEGPITLKDGAYEYLETGTALNDIILRATASSQEISIDQLTAKTGEAGVVNGDGWIDLQSDENFPFSLKLALKNAELVSRDDIEAMISGDLAMLGNIQDATIEGNLAVNRAELSIPEGGGIDLPDIDIEEIGATIVNVDKPERDQQKAFDPLLDIRVAMPNKIFVRGRGLDSEWQGNLQVSGPSSAPRITGDLEVRKGFFDFIEKRFVIEKGLIDFKGASPPNPLLSIEAAATDGDFKAIIKLDGQANDPKLRLESEPALPEDEVLARLLFDRELSEITATDAATLALALNQLRGGGGFDAFAEIRNVLRIDTLDIVSGEEFGDSRLKAGKYLNDDIYVEVEQGAVEESSKARVEIEVLPNVAIEADTGSDQSGGVGIKWRFDY